jgi:ABC-type multidrug transport system ATPase subunit
MTGFAKNIPKKILNGVSFEIQSGEIYGFLGLNGAGKTTTLETIMGFHTPDSGQIEFF